jgi:hypothetical protein
MRKTRAVRDNLVGLDSLAMAKELKAQQESARQNLADAVKALAKKQYTDHKQQTDFEAALFNVLSQRPKWWWISEVRKLTASVLKITTKVSPAGDEITCVEEAPWLRVPLWDDDTAAVVQTLNINETWSALSRKQRDAAQKRRKRFESIPSGVFQQGRPPRVPPSLVLHYAKLIEEATGKLKFSRSHIPNICNKPNGPQLSVLMAALDHACFATPCPAAEAIIKIVWPRK